MIIGNWQGEALNFTLPDPLAVQKLNTPHNGRELRMAMKGQETATEAEVEKGIRGKLVEDLKAVGADGDEMKAISVIF
jgi:hypothetical protein